MVWINNIPALVQIMAWCRPGDKPLSEPMVVSLLMHKCATRLQWVKHYHSIVFLHHSPIMIQQSMMSQKSLLMWNGRIWSYFEPTIHTPLLACGWAIQCLFRVFLMKLAILWETRLYQELHSSTSLLHCGHVYHVAILHITHTSLHEHLSRHFPSSILIQPPVHMRPLDVI